jgi:tRNA threonylcarbamoyladenosine biosynthesis protein TsaE
MEIITNNSRQTKKLGEFLAKKLKQGVRKKAFILALRGNLGGGKTTFLQGFAKGLGIKQKVLSPTFVILKRFKIKDLRLKNFYHIDCYRIRKSKEILDLGFKKIISDPKNIVAIEWAEKIKKILPKNTIWIKFEFVDENKRKIKISKN